MMIRKKVEEKPKHKLYNDKNWYLTDEQIAEMNKKIEEQYQLHDAYTYTYFCDFLLKKYD